MDKILLTCVVQLTDGVKLSKTKKTIGVNNAVLYTLHLKLRCSKNKVGNLLNDIFYTENNQIWWKSTSKKWEMFLMKVRLDWVPIKISGGFLQIQVMMELQQIFLKKVR